ncbi:MAG: DUF4169 family protein [Bradyrhizobiaceae bacterium]|nr:MAG: DUF4169 family protein [Bradyrhizobiaceae bacterium]
MGDLVNLKKFKKHIQREKAASEADRNRIRFGRTKAQKKSDNQMADRAERKLDQHRLDDGTQS